MQCKWCRDECTNKTKSHNESRKPWKASEAPVLGRYNTPPLQEDLVLRSSMAPERNGRGREEVKLSCFFDQCVKPMNHERLKTWKNNTIELNEIESIPVEKRSKEHHVNLEGFKAMNDEYNGQEGIGTTLVEMRKTRSKEEQIRTTLRLKGDARLDKMKITWRDDTTFRLNG